MDREPKVIATAQAPETVNDPQISAGKVRQILLLQPAIRTISDRLN
jgi:hypothetical protein